MAKLIPFAVPANHRSLSRIWSPDRGKVLLFPTRGEVIKERLCQLQDQLEELDHRHARKVENAFSRPNLWNGWGTKF
jgi:hypothetical protein